MNERIRELEDQCWVQVPCDFDIDKGGLSTIRTVFDRTKFAELIVRECAKLNFRELGLSGSASFDVSRMIKKHFGVEE